LRRVGVYGGAFDPPHLGHLSLAKVALEQLQLESLHIIPTGDAWHKASRLSDASHRLAMVRLAFGGWPQVVVDGRELSRAGPSYTIDTLQELQAEMPHTQFFVVVGEDQARKFTSWHRWGDLLQLAKIAVAVRADTTINAPAFAPPKGYGDCFLWLDMPPQDISSTDIRRRLAAHLSAAPLVDPTVARYIDQNHLYQTSQ